MKKMYSFRLPKDFKEILNKARKRIFEENKHMFGSEKEISQSKTIEIVLRTFVEKK